MIRLRVPRMALTMVSFLLLGCGEAPDPDPIVSLNVNVMSQGSDTLVIVATVRNTGSVNTEFPCGPLIPQLTIYDIDGETVPVIPCGYWAPCVQGPAWVLRPSEERRHKLIVSGTRWNDDCEEVPLESGLYTVIASFSYGERQPRSGYPEYVEQRREFQWPLPQTELARERRAGL